MERRSGGMKFSCLENYDCFANNFDVAEDRKCFCELSYIVLYPAFLNKKFIRAT
jgi:hypothetical protein